MWKVRLLALLMTALALPAAAQSPADLKPTPPAQVPAASEAPASAPAPASTLTKADVDTWLDGYMPYALQTGDIAGAVVVVVKDGQVLTQRGFGYADVKEKKPVDPAGTLFRPGSISKLFTWTAVMQQVQAGKLDLDRDVNDYLDYKIPPAFGKPITLRHIMTHTPGFEETAKYLLLTDPKLAKPLGEAMKRWVPTRIYAPGQIPAYSNYGASMAGYIVERVSGEPFAQYIQNHIFTPLGMQHSTFVQPLPANLAGGMSKGYEQASKDPQPFEIIDMSPAGALSATGADMAQFMIAHLAHGGPLLDKATAEQMYANANTPYPGLPAMGLGFYHEDRNGHRIVGHGGDTDVFHSDLHLFIDDGVGLYMSFNSAGREAAAHVLREHVFVDFTDRYFPQPKPELPTAPTAKEHAQVMAGHYVSSRGSETNFMRLFSLLGEAQIVANDDDTITVSALLDAARVPKRWREVGPWLWQDAEGKERLAAVVKDGKVVMFSIGAYAPIIEFVPAPGSLNAGWITPVMAVALGVLALTALSWPVVALVRRRYRYNPGITGRTLILHRATRAAAWLVLVFVLGWGLMLSVINHGVDALDGRLDIWMRLMQLVLLATIAGTVAAAWNAYDIATRGGRRPWTTAWAVLVALSLVFFVWAAINVKLLTATLNF
ncbi:MULTISPECIES: serine hydrolase domain-containing protein [Nitrospirillum]|uniref:CubicO group peptidase (Beta-lactamase class C family) n=1 Tax=Nitrospirillum amazonense TaxID=28077 RepID=A0A560FJB6_9PROT|nr:serine hydrolase domain-containing protein [Nitrospirillum amazonense]MEC4592338.1 serine hydrolase [Nitrospirillum amazonense]TWB21695.1 CubicO group peptidase (beta-lactamase class C family) [Nitrospirillum amazonense]